MAHEPKARRGVLLGFDEQEKGYQILDILTRKVIVSRNVIVNELVMPFKDAAKPCLIMLKFGTWPKSLDLPLIRSGGGSNATSDMDIEVRTEADFSNHPSNLDTTNRSDEKSPDYPVFEENPIIPDSKENTEDKSGNSKIFPPDPEAKHNSPVIPMLPDMENLTPLSKSVSKPDTPLMQDVPPDFPKSPPNFSVEKSPLKLSLDARFNPVKKTNIFFPHTTEISPIQDSSRKRSRPPDNFITDLNLETPVLGKGAAKKYEKFKDNFYLKSAPKARLDFYVKKSLEGNATKRQKISKAKVDDLPAIAEEYFEGQPAWEVKEIKKAKEDNTGWKYYVRYTGKHKDGWLSSEDLKGSQRLLNDFWNKKKTKSKKKSKQPSRTLDIPTVKPSKSIPEHVTAKFNLGAGLRRSARLSGSNIAPEFVNLTDTLFKEASHEDKQKSLNKTLEEEGLPEDANLEEINLTSTEFKLPPDFSADHIHQVPKDIDMDEVIALALESITILVDGGTLQETKPDSQNEMRAGARRDEYTQAEHRELFELDANKTFAITFLPEGRKAITCRWVYDLKRDINNEIVRFKARLVVQGFKQIEGIDFQKTFSSVAQIRTFRLIVALAVRLNLRLTQYDISNAFLNADLDTDIYMTFPPGYPPKSGDPKEIFELLKGLYGLKQASRLWKNVLVKAFKKAGLKVCQTESGVLQFTGSTLCLVNIHVDDYIICTADEELRIKIEKAMASLFSVTALGELKLYLGIVAEQGKTADGRRKYKLYQGPYHERFLTKMNYLKAKIAKSPADPSAKLSILDCPGEGVAKPAWPYMSVGGSFMYSAMGTRPDLCPRTIKLARFNKNPGDSHVNAQKHMLRYLKNTVNRGITFTEPTEMKDNKLDIIAFVDSDWGGCPDTRRSTVGYVVFVCGGPIAWKSQLKKTLALSSCEAEFMGLTDVARELMWLMNFLDEVGIEYNTPKIYCDSNSAICWAEDPVQHQRNKHVELKYYFIRDVVSKRLVKIYKINTLYNVADVMTKDMTTRMCEDLVPPLMGECEPTIQE